jgi:uncharacterized MAPEG superfamily protein
MTIALWCVLIGAFLPVTFAGYAKRLGRFGLRDNHNPREFMAKLEGPAQRANWAHQNTFEAYPPFAAAVLAATHIGKIDPQVLDMLAVGWVVLRLAYGVLYITDQAKTRSVAWTLAVGCWVAMFLLSA